MDNLMNHLIKYVLKAYRRHLEKNIGDKFDRTLSLKLDAIHFLLGD